MLRLINRELIKCYENYKSKNLETEILNDIFQTVYENNKRIYNDNEIELYTCGHLLDDRVNRKYEWTNYESDKIKVGYIIKCILEVKNKIFDGLGIKYKVDNPNSCIVLKVKKYDPKITIVMFPHKLDINGKLKVTIKTVYDDTRFIKKHVGDVYMMLKKLENIYIIEL